MKTGKSFFTKTHHLQQERPRLSVSLGDPAGIGPEVVLKALADPEVTTNCEITVIGSRSLLQATYIQLRQNLDNPDALADPDQLSIIDIELEASDERRSEE